MRIPSSVGTAMSMPETQEIKVKGEHARRTQVLTASYFALLHFALLHDVKLTAFWCETKQPLLITSCFAHVL